jgi:hypothetical protein
MKNIEILNLVAFSPITILHESEPSRHILTLNFRSKPQIFATTRTKFLNLTYNYRIKKILIAKTRKEKDNKMRNHNICYFEQWNRCQI